MALTDLVTCYAVRFRPNGRSGTGLRLAAVTVFPVIVCMASRRGGNAHPVFPATVH